jgi:CheY-like chemotaxis protein
MTILIVEDDPANQYTLELMLKSEGYHVVIAGNGREGIEKALSLQPDLILMDMMMPIMGGHEATRTLKDDPEAADIPIIALTAAAMAGDREKALAAGCNDYISKPVDRPYLIERIEHWLGPDAGTGTDGPETPQAQPTGGESPASD